MKQKTALDILKAGRNVYLTGAAGTGKTYVLNEYIKYLKERGVKIGVTASTGIAATHLSGMTIHSWTGIGIKDYLSDYDIDDLTQKKYLHKRFEGTQVLIVDEVSMLAPTFIDMIDEVCRAMKRSEVPFGGMQVVFSGDFYQLPPINRSGGETEFAFQAGVWQSANIRTCYLTEQFRQDDDSFTEILNDIRDGSVTNKTHAALESRINATLKTDTEVTRLYTHNMDVDSRNEKELAKIKGKTHVFDMTEKGKRNLADALKRSVLAPQMLELKKDATVMFVKNNFDEGYVNGTIGKIVDFDKGVPVVETLAGDRIYAYAEQWAIEENGKELASVEQIPLRLAWAITVHKSQGMSLDAAEIDLSKAFVPGHGYVALSRLRSLDGLILTGLNKTALVMHPVAVQLDEYLRRDSGKWTKVIARFSDEDLDEMHKQFILDSDGTLDEDEIEENKKKAVQGVEPKISTYEKTYNLLNEFESIADVAKERKLTEGTIVGHLQKLKEIKDDLDLERFNTIPSQDFDIISSTFEEYGTERLTPVFKALKGKYSYEELRLATLFLEF